MLEIRNYYLSYVGGTSDSTYKGRRIEIENLKLPERGMIFLLGEYDIYNYRNPAEALLGGIAGLDRFFEGEVLFRGESLGACGSAKFDAFRNTHVGYIAREALYTCTSWKASMRAVLHTQGKLFAKKRIAEALAFVGLEDAGQKELTGLDEQKAMVACALVKDPSILLYNAFFENPSYYQLELAEVYELLSKIANEKLVIVATRERDIAMQYGDRIITFKENDIVSDKTPAEMAEESDEEMSQEQPEVEDFDKSEQEIDLRMMENYTEELLASMSEEEIREIASQAQVDSPEELRLHKTKFRRPRVALELLPKTLFCGMFASKPFRTLYTSLVILLMAFSMSILGLVQMCFSYDTEKEATRYLLKSENPIISLALGRKTETYGEGDKKPKYVDYDVFDGFNNQDVEDLAAKTGMEFYPVYNGTNNLAFVHVAGSNVSSATMGNKGSAGVTELPVEKYSDFGFTLAAGRLPAKAGEVVVSQCFADIFRITITEVLTRNVTLNFENGSRTFLIVGILDTGLTGNEYLSEDADNERNMVHTCLFAGPGTMATLPSTFVNYHAHGNGEVRTEYESGNAYVVKSHESGQYHMMIGSTAGAKEAHLLPLAEGHFSEEENYKFVILDRAMHDLEGVKEDGIIGFGVWFLFFALAFFGFSVVAGFLNTTVSLDNCVWEMYEMRFIGGGKSSVIAVGIGDALVKTFAALAISFIPMAFFSGLLNDYFADHGAPVNVLRVNFPGVVLIFAVGFALAVFANSLPTIRATQKTPFEMRNEYIESVK